MYWPTKQYAIEYQEHGLLNDLLSVGILDEFVPFAAANLTLDAAVLSLELPLWITHALV